MSKTSPSSNWTIADNLRSVRTVTAILVMTVLLVVGPWYLTTFQLFLASGTLFLATFAVTWDFFTGMSGYFNFGHMVLIGLGGYASVLLEAELGLPIWGTILLATLITGLFGTIVLAGPSLRLSGIYFAAITLIVMIWSENLIVLFSDITGGLQGYLYVASLGRELETVFPIGVGSQMLTYYVAALNFLLVTGILLLIAKSDLGKMLLAIRQNEQLLASLGLNPTRFKITGFAIMALLAGFSGALWSHAITTLSPATQLSLSAMIDIVIASVIGGLGTIVGAAIGIFFLEAIDFFLTLIHGTGFFETTLHVDIREFRRVIWMSIALVFMFFYPAGIYPRLRRLLNRVDARLEGDDE
jgi:branched-chain amino acid transport system permease protein